MEQQVYGIYDVKAGEYSRPVFYANDAQAIREWSDVCKEKNTMFFKHPGDFVMHCLGTFDTKSGKFEALKQPRHIAAASDFVFEAEKVGSIA